MGTKYFRQWNHEQRKTTQFYRLCVDTQKKTGYINSYLLALKNVLCSLLPYFFFFSLMQQISPIIFIYLFFFFFLMLQVLLGWGWADVIQPLCLLKTLFSGTAGSVRAPRDGGELCSQVQHTKCSKGWSRLWLSRLKSPVSRMEAKEISFFLQWSLEDVPTALSSQVIVFQHFYPAFPQWSIQYLRCKEHITCTCCSVIFWAACQNHLCAALSSILSPYTSSLNCIKGSSLQLLYQKAKHLRTPGGASERSVEHIMEHWRHGTAVSVTSSLTSGVGQTQVIRPCMVLEHLLNIKKPCLQFGDAARNFAVVSSLLSKTAAARRSGEIKP